MNLTLWSGDSLVVRRIQINSALSLPWGLTSFGLEPPKGGFIFKDPFLSKAPGNTRGACSET